MTRINIGRVVLGGLVTGLVMNVVDFLVNDFWLGSRWQVETTALNPKLNLMSAGTAIGFVTADFALGILLVWLYAGIRTRFGARPRTALIAAFYFWLACVAYSSSYVTLGLYSAGLIVTSLLASLVSMTLGAYAGAALYRE